ncbi:hypothetical protein DR64_8671 [Paraburkholderia xenovorans LB400]|uniref:Uncharacterized protein n=1 Tax=Paraburkholderia xenovorans (strain LB400) TaxID=266265 RepID=Q13FZ5_PARXL|nr:hypothetical protein Bxe_C1128 [Paraburkholderia xenovorans LB400]AIP34552.1 hypothetical protein DR64_8671 [Paraburkholderia xenovorans LB400]
MGAECRQGGIPMTHRSSCAHAVLWQRLSTGEQRCDAPHIGIFGLKASDIGQQQRKQRMYLSNDYSRHATGPCGVDAGSLTLQR